VDGMYEIAEQVQQWIAGGRAVMVAQVVATKGFSSREPSAALVWSEGDSAGGLLPVIDKRLLGATDSGIVDVTVTDSDAVAGGLSCGGVATVLIQRADTYPDDTWTRLAQREPLCLLTEVGADGAVRTDSYGPATVRDAATRPGAEDVPRLFARGVSSTHVVRSGATSLVVVALWPATTLVVVGDGAIAAALADAGALLGWTAQVTPAADADALGRLRESDAVLVLSHDREVDAPALAAALSGRCGYVGALGSRRTQAARREWLSAHGVDDVTQARIYGPAGLDIDAHTPGEIAISVTAEILASRSNSTGGSLRDRRGPVHTAGVSAPPPRYQI
jgi:xanthine dehydrogenase accessory factor